MRQRVDAVRRELDTGRPFEFSDCAIGNLVFAGCYLLRGRRFNDAVDDYCALLGLPTGLIDNVTDGTNAFLVALERDRGVLVSEAEIVDAKLQNRISDVFLIDRPLSEDDRTALARLSKEQCVAWLEERSILMPLNPRLRERIAAADLIIYAPGTQHSSLFPSYLTKDLSRAIASNLTAIKLLVTNIQADAEISGSTRRRHHRARRLLPEGEREAAASGADASSRTTSSTIRRILETDPDAGYVPLGHLETLEDPRLVRIGHYEDGVSGRHDASKVLTPFLEAFVSQRRRQRIAVWLYDAASLNKLSQSVLETVRGGIQDLGRRRHGLLHRRRRSRRRVHAAAADRAAESSRQCRCPPGKAFVQALAEREFDYAVLFESSGMYRGEDLVGILSPLTTGRLDAVWGSRRSVAERHRGVVSPSLQPQRDARIDELVRQPSAERRISRAVRPLHLGHAVGRAGRAGVIPDEPARGA